MSTLVHSAGSLTAGPATPDGFIRLGLIDSGGAGLADLTGSPQTIGSGPRCSVRLGGRGLRPLHCVITPGKNGPVVRRWAAETRLNGLDFTEAALSAGDLLRIGSIDLQVVELPSGTPAGRASEPVRQADQHADADPSPVPSLPVSVSAEPALPPLAEADWLDDSISELLAAVDSANHAAPVAVFDAAIPSRLLRPGAAGAPPAAEAFDGQAEAEVDAAVASDDASGDEAASDDVSSEDVSSEDVAAIGPNCTATNADSSAIERFRKRAAARRARVSALIAALRDERRQTADLAEEVSGLASQLEQALIASDGAAAELARLAEERVEAEDGRAAAHHALDEATRRAEQLDAQVADLEAKVADLEAQVAALEATLAATATSPESADTAASSSEEHASVVEGPLETESLAPQWTLDADAVPVFADGVFDSEGEAAFHFAGEADEEHSSACPTQPEPESAETEDGPLWGIERLATTEEPSIGESLWPPTPAPSDTTENVASLDEATEKQTGEPHDAELDRDSGYASDSGDDSDPAPAAEEDHEPAFEPSAVVEEDFQRIAALLASHQTGAEFENAGPPTGVESGIADDQDQAAAAPRPEPQASFIERFASLMPEDGEPVEPPKPVAAAPTTAVSDDDESIDDYMRKLMQRVRGSSTEDAAPAKNPATLAAIAETTGKATLQPALRTAADPPAANSGMLRDLSELRRTPSPEVTTDMGALRQLANQSARHAIDVAQSRQSREKATMRVTVSVLSVVVGALAAIFAESPLDSQFFGGVASALIGAWFFVRTVRQCQAPTLDEQIARFTKHADLTPSAP